MTEHTTADDEPEHRYDEAVVGALEAPDEFEPRVHTHASPAERRAVAYVNRVLDVKGPSDEPALDLVEYVQYVTSDQRRRRKEPTNLRYQTAIPR